MDTCRVQIFSRRGSDLENGSALHVEIVKKKGIGDDYERMTFGAQMDPGNARIA